MPVPEIVVNIAHIGKVNEGEWLEGRNSKHMSGFPGEVVNQSQDAEAPAVDLRVDRAAEQQDLRFRKRG